MVENLFRDNVSRLSDNRVQVQISSGPTYQPISIWVNEFRPINDEFLEVSHIKTGENGHPSSKFIRRYAPPYMLHQNEIKTLGDKCMEHVKLIAKNPRGKGELYFKYTSIVPWKVFNAIRRYHDSTDVSSISCIYVVHFLNDHRTG